jgi:hypothetical protein
MDVDTGSEYCEKIRMVIAAPNSIDEPRLGEWYVSLLPITAAVVSHHHPVVQKHFQGKEDSPFMMLYPYVINPIQITAAVTPSCHMGTSALEALGRPVDHAEYIPAHTPTAFPTSFAPCANDAVHAVITCTYEYRCSTSLAYLGAWA